MLRKICQNRWRDVTALAPAVSVISSQYANGGGIIRRNLVMLMAVSQRATGIGKGLDLHEVMT
jgi:hypothetical protein